MSTEYERSFREVERALDAALESGRAALTDSDVQLIDESDRGPREWFSWGCQLTQQSDADGWRRIVRVSARYLHPYQGSGEGRVELHGRAERLRLVNFVTSLTWTESRDISLDAAVSGALVRNLAALLSEGMEFVREAPT